MIRELAQGIDGLVTIAYHAPGQLVRTFQQLPPDDRNAIVKAVRARIPLGDTMKEGYYFGNPQLFKMPRYFTKATPALTAPAMPMGEFKEDKLTKALPFIAVGIAGIVAYNIFFRKGK